MEAGLSGLNTVAALARADQQEKRQGVESATILLHNMEVTRVNHLYPGLFQMEPVKTKLNTRTKVVLHTPVQLVSLFFPFCFRNFSLRLSFSSFRI